MRAVWSICATPCPMVCGFAPAWRGPLGRAVLAGLSATGWVVAALSVHAAVLIWVRGASTGADPPTAVALIWCCGMRVAPAIVVSAAGTSKSGTSSSSGASVWVHGILGRSVHRLLHFAIIVAVLSLLLPLLPPNVQLKNWLLCCSRLIKSALSCATNVRRARLARRALYRTYLAPATSSATQGSMLQ